MTPIDLDDLRIRVLAGEQLTPELAQQVVNQLRSGRISSAETAAKRKGKSPINEQVIMADLDAALGL
jgi:hypothetical protein